VAGVTVYFPVFAAGALFHIGDGHAVQGDGEIVGTGIEISFDVQFTVDLQKGKQIYWPRGENSEYIFTVGNARPLDQCVQHATTEMARWLEARPQVARVFYPGLASHPQHVLAMRQQTAGGAIVSFEVHGERDAAWRVVDNCRLLSITANLGDTKTTITHPASTTHGRISAEARAASGIGEGLLRIAVGLESSADLQADLARGLG